MSNYRNEKITILNNLINDLNVAEKIELSIFNFTNEYILNNNISDLFNEIYEDKFNDIINITDLKQFIYILYEEKKISPEDIAYLKNEELFPSKYKDILQKTAIQNNKVGSNAFTCKKCKEKNVEITQKQTRSGDEPPTIFVKCLECGYSFKFS